MTAWKSAHGRGVRTHMLEKRMITSATYSPFQNSVVHFNRSARSSAASAAGNQPSSACIADTFAFADRNAAPAYAPSTTAKKTASTIPSVATADDRRSTAEQYNALLADLRSRYSEAEAMRQFDEILRDDGYELIANIPAGPLGLNSKSGKISGLAENLCSLYGNCDKELIEELSGARADIDRDASLVMQSNVYGGWVNGKPEASAESWALFSPDRPFSAELQNYWKNRYAGELDASAGLDVGAFISKLPDSAQRSAVAVNTDIASIVSGLLKENGIELESGEHLHLGFDPKFGVTVNLDARPGVSDIFAESPELRAAVEAQFYTPPPEDISKLPGLYEDGDRSIDYSINRYITYSADEPSAVVVNDFLNVLGNGYTYAKKTGDHFDPNAEYVHTRQTVPVASSFFHDGDFYAHVQSAVNAANGLVRRALDSGQTVEGSIPRSVLEKNMDDAMAAYEKHVAGLTLYEATPTGAKVIQRGDDAHKEPAANAAPGDRDVSESPSCFAEEQAARETERMASLQKIVDRIRSRYFAIDSLFRPPSAAKQVESYASRFE